MLLPLAPLLAAGLDWLEGLLPLFFVMIWIVSQVWGVFRKIGGNGNAKPPRADPVPRPAPRPADADLRGELEKQIEEFLRETGRPAQPAPKSTPPRSARKPRKPSQPQQPRSPGSPPAAPPRLPPQADRSSGERTIGSLAERTSDIARHVEDAFADDLVHRKATASTVNAEPSGLGVQPAAPLDLVRLLRNPATLRQLILVREVLDRPLDRW